MLNSQTKSEQPLKSKCSKCGGSHYILSYDQEGRPIATPCECLGKEIAESKLRFADIPEMYSDSDFESFKDVYYKDKKEIRFILAVCRNYVDNYGKKRSEGEGLYFYSQTKGSGKTMLTTAIAHELQKKDVTVKFSTSPTIIREIKKTWEEKGQGESKLLHDLAAVEVLIIDDFGTEKVADWINEKFFQIINERYVTKKPTIISSNYSVDELVYDERIGNRLKERNIVLHFPEESVRDLIGKLRLEKLREELANGQ